MTEPKQPQDRKPSARRQTATSRKRRQTALDTEAVGIRVDGVDYVINPNDLTGRVEFEIRKEIGMGLAELHQRLQASPGIDYLGMFLWAVRHANGEQVDLMDVLDGVNAGSEIEVLKDGDLADAQDAAPKA